MASCPEVPLLDIHQRPRVNGKIRKVKATGGIIWFDPISQEWRDAVRLDDIRRKVIDETSRAGEYRYPKSGNKDGEDPLNVTSFLLKDQPYGYERQDRPDILFTLREPLNRRNEKPTGYLMDGERVCLDPFLHGIRGFDELPKTISAAVDGQDIEYWIRQNAQISRYDIMARMPSTCTIKGRRWVQPPSLNALTQRASRFRAKAGCLSWEINSGTDNKNQYLLSILPEDCKRPDVNSTKAVEKDLDDTQTKVELVAANKGKFQQKRRKDKRSKEAETINEDNDSKHALVEPNDIAEIERKGKSRVLAISTEPDRGYDQQVPSAKRQRTNAAANSSEDLPTSTASQVIPTRRSSRRAQSKSVVYLESEDEFEENEAPKGHTIGTAKTPRQNTATKNLPEEVSVTSPPVSKAALRVLAKYGTDLDSDLQPAYSPEFELETEEALMQGKADLRYLTPTEAVEKAYIRRAIELTCIDFCWKKGFAIYSDLIESHRHESYEWQHRQIEEEFKRHWCGAKRPKLYHLPAWTGTIDRWRVPKDDWQGQCLMTKLIKAEKAAWEDDV